jgi:hypothetical protein
MVSIALHRYFPAELHWVNVEDRHTPNVEAGISLNLKKSVQFLLLEQKQN